MPAIDVFRLNHSTTYLPDRSPQLASSAAPARFRSASVTGPSGGRMAGLLSADSGCEQSQQKNLLDHLVGGDKQPRWHGQAERTLGDWSSLLRPLKWANSLLIFLLAGNLVWRQVRIRLHPQAQPICESPVHFRCSGFAITDSRPRPERWQAQDVVGCL
jgi:hypothetical protein